MLAMSLFSPRISSPHNEVGIGRLSNQFQPMRLHQNHHIPDLNSQIAHTKSVLLSYRPRTFLSKPGFRSQIESHLRQAWPQLNRFGLEILFAIIAINVG